MAKVQIEVEYDENLLAEAVDSNVGLDDVARMIAAAGAMEAILTATEIEVAETAPQIQRLRVYCLLKQGVPHEKVERLAASVFHIPLKSAQSLVRRTMARYATKLRTGMAADVELVLKDAEWDAAARRWRVTVPGEYVITRIEEMCVAGNLALPVQTEFAQIYLLMDEAYQPLRTRLKMGPRTLPH